jgi:hypothetical protein
MRNQNKVLRYFTEFRWMTDDSEDDVLRDLEKKALKITVTHTENCQHW